jgi:Fe-S cluster biogenesis protein NfuA
MLQKIEKIISEQIRPAIQEHGGDIEIGSLQDGILKIKLLGSCVGCSYAKTTTVENVKKIILLEDLGVKDVILETGVSEDLIEMARKLLAKKNT